ncbi:expressed unknown protein [Seminavis robusta]|uniref:Uncharacterized protein n=1 Tax=Seminavis robusta TaxID=568900 RepID=A0A9N8HXT6_9STRA|nr:expressed unknown protein [Seminavis robusta]|eukprot:Sro2305_g322640.1 n/a (162) ;mRNA; r:9285-9770
MSGGGGGRKRKQVNLLDPDFLQALIASSDNNNDDDEVLLQLTHGAYQGLQDCQEAFIQTLAQQLKEITSGDDKQGVRHVQQAQVEQAIRNMGLEDVLDDALEYLQQKQQREEEDEEGKPVKKRKAKKKIAAKAKKGKFTDEMAAEQERLLQASALRQQHDK